MIHSLPKVRLTLQNIDPFRYIDRGFDLDIEGQSILDQKGKKVGKVIAHELNMGVALVDMPKIEVNGPKHKYSLAEHRVVMWSPLWMDKG